MSDLEDFLRREAAKRRERAGSSGAGRPPLETAGAQQAGKPPRSVPAARPVAGPASIGDEGVSEHVRRHLNEDEFRVSAEALGDEVKMADDDMSAHVHQVFDHGVGDLAEHAEARGRPYRLPPLLSFLKDANQLRQAVILSEILHRKEY